MECLVKIPLTPWYMWWRNLTWNIEINTIGSSSLSTKFYSVLMFPQHSLQTCSFSISHFQSDEHFHWARIGKNTKKTTTGIVFTDAIYDTLTFSVEQVKISCKHFIFMFWYPLIVNIFFQTKGTWVNEQEKIRLWFHRMNVQTEKNDEDIFLKKKVSTNIDTKTKITKNDNGRTVCMLRFGYFTLLCALFCRCC